MSAVAMRMNPATAVSFRVPVLPWAVALDDELRFRHISRRILVTCALVCLVLPWLPVSKPDRTEVLQVPLPMAKLLLDNVVKLPPPAPAPTAPQERKNVAEAPKAVARNKETQVPEARVPVSNKLAGELDAARRKAAGVGLLAMKDSLAELHGAPVAEQLKAAIQPGPGVGSGVGAGIGAGNTLGLPSRALITSNASGGSGGINTASYSRDTGGGGLAGRSTTLVEGVAGGGGGGGAGGGGARGRGDGTGSGIGGSNAGGAVQRGSSGKAARSIEDIKLVFERNKGAIYAIYNRALRADPSLQGKVVLKLTIAPSGEVMDCRIESSELRQPELEGKLLARIRQFDFGAKDVGQMIVSWPIDFLPS
jgi:TonB family protein